MNIFSIIKNRITLVVLILIVFAVLLYFLTPNIPQQTLRPTPSPTSNIVSTLFTTTIGTNQAQIEQLANLKNKETKDNQTNYSFSTPAQTRDDLIITEGGKVIFERKVTVEPNFAHPVLSETLAPLGTPEKEFKGSYYYGEEFITYIYPSKGISVVGNPLSNEVYEINQFKPMTVEEYEKQWGTDLHTFEGHQEQQF